ncbi:MAG: DUF4238 domain-containing protein [Candidatus Paceibacterota bacterium]|jgi:hypothetical protein
MIIFNKINKIINHQRLILADKIMSYCLDKEIDKVFLAKFIFNIYNKLIKDVYVLEHKKAVHHYIPKFLLKRFSIPRTGQIYQYGYFKKNNPISIYKEAACTPNLYSFRDKETKQQSDFIEKQIFALTLEKYTSRIINKIIKNDEINLTNFERSILTSFIAFQYTRTPKFFLQIRLILEYLSLEKKINIEEMTKKDFFKKALFDNYYNINPVEYFKFTNKNNQSLVGMENLIIKISILTADYLSGLLYKYELRMLESKEPAFFYLSDSPANIYDINEFRSLGIFLWELNQNFLIYLPITINRCLYYIKPNSDIKPYIIGGIIEEAILSSIFEFAYSDRKDKIIESFFEEVDNFTTQ